MGMLHVCLLALTVSGTISRCEAIFGPIDIVGVEHQRPAFLSGCGAKKSVNVRFNEIRVAGPDSDVVYQRAAVRRADFDFATIETVDLLRDGFVECAKAAGSEGVDAFSFDGACSGHRFDKRIAKCGTGDWVVFVRDVEHLDRAPVVTSFDQAPYEEVVHEQFGYTDRLYKMFAPVNHPFLTKINQNSVTKTEHFIDPENATQMSLFYAFLDVNVCLTDGSYGVPMFLARRMHDLNWPILYFFHECGKTITIRDTGFTRDAFVFSHPGFGCKNYPSWLPDECTVTFEIVDSSEIRSVYGLYFPKNSPVDPEFKMTVSGTNSQGGSETKNVDQFNTVSFIGPYNTYTYSVLRQPSVPAIGFVIEFT